MPTFRQDEKLGTKVPLIKTADINDKSITKEKLAEGSVTNSKLAPESVTQDKFDKELLQIFKVAAGLPENLIETIQNVDTTLTDHQRQISSNDDDISDLQTKTKQIKDTVDGIAVSGGASVGSAVTYNNTQSGLDAQNIQNAIDEIVNNLGHYETNEEWLRVYTDAEGKFLWGIRVDGSIDWSVGIPKPVQKALNEIIANNETFQQTLNEAMDAYKATIDEKVATIDEKVAAIDEKKVDKEEGKSLIEDEVKECFRVIENEEYIIAVVDAENRILAGIKYDGEPYFPNHEMYSVITNEEWLYAIIDAEDKVLGGFRADDGHMVVGNIDISTFISNAIVDITDIKERTSHLSAIDNDEYLSVEIDAEGKIIGYIAPDGSHYLYKVKSETIPTEFEHIEDPEGRMEVTTDADYRILAYRDLDGVKHENSMSIDKLKVSSLNLQGNSVHNIEEALKSSGFNVNTPIDWSEKDFIQIPEPRFAIANITGITAMPTSKTQNLHAWMEFLDMQGNYFKKRVILNAQGSSSMGFVKKNAAIDICNDEWIGDDTTNIRFGNWVPQDSFHLKAYYTDFFRGISVVCYKLYEQIVRTRDFIEDKPWKKSLLDKKSIGITTKSIGSNLDGKIDLQTDTGALCHPDGFPIALYLNDVFYGVFSWQIKKHRDNYHMNKSTAEHIHLDGLLNEKTIFNGKDNIDWSMFEIRNPKNLYTLSGNKYDADIKQEEIAGTDEVNTWISEGKLPDETVITSKIKKALQMTANVKKYIQNLSDSLIAINSAKETYESSSKTQEDLNAFKKVYETYFDVDNQHDYLLFSWFIKNGDGFNKNWQWLTYDGVKWFVVCYDCDCSFGANPNGNGISAPFDKNIMPWYGIKNNIPCSYAYTYYNDIIVERYKELRKAGVISKETAFNMLKEWMSRIGTYFYTLEYEKWKDSPCISNSVVREEYWSITKDSNGNPITSNTETFDATKAYNIGDEVTFGLNMENGFFKFTCVKNTQALTVNTPHTVSTYSPISKFKHCDNIYRIEKWMDNAIDNLDKIFNV